MKARLLHRNEDFDVNADLPSNADDLVRDLELTTLLTAMARGDDFLFDVSRRVVLTSLDDPAAITYRQDVLRDCIAQPEIVRELYAVSVEAIEQRQRLWLFASNQPSSILHGARQQLELFVTLLQRQRHLADEHAAKFHSEGFTRLFTSLQRELDDEYFRTIGRHLKQLRFRDGVLVSAELGRDNSGIRFVLRSALTRPGLMTRMGLPSRSTYSFTVPPRDLAGGEALSDLKNRGLNLVANALAQSTDHIVSYLALLRVELGFYVSCLNLRDQLEAKGEPICLPTPRPCSPTDLTCSGLGDVCLALRTTDRVVGNDVEGAEKDLIVITGANSGGKSTFLRSVGLAQLMMQCGLIVLADAYRASVCDRLFTHFIREEDATMSSGRLDEELGRMAKIADRIRPYSLVLFNESFAATNENEGSEIARQVVHALLDENIRVFIVSHLFQFTHGYYEAQSNSSLFLRAEREHGGRRVFKLVEAEPLSTSFGRDLYEKVFAADHPAGVSRSIRDEEPR